MPNPDGTLTDEERKAHRQPSTYTNFNNYFNANKTAAKSQADMYGEQVRKKNIDAQNALQGAQQQFGTNVGAATAGATGVPVQTAADEEQNGTAYYERSQIDKGAGQTYSGPTGLNETADYQKAVDASTAAQSATNQLGTRGGIQSLIQQNNTGGNAGTSGFSSNLVGQAGKPQFSALRSQFNPGQGIKDAEDAAKLQADSAAADVAAKAKTWADLGTQYDATKAASDAKNAKIAQDYQDKLKKDAATKQAAENSLASLPAYDKVAHYKWSDMHDQDVIIDHLANGYAQSKDTFLPSAGLDKIQVRKVIESMSDEEFSRWRDLLQLKSGNNAADWKRAADYLKFKAQGAGI